MNNQEQLSGSGGNRQSQVSEQISDLERNASELEEATSSLLNRLDSVLRYDQPKEKPESKPSTVAENIVSLAASIREINYRIVRQTKAIRDILDRLEI